MWNHIEVVAWQYNEFWVRKVNHDITLEVIVVFSFILSNTRYCTV